jgi:hypothetical protein
LVAFRALDVPRRAVVDTASGVRRVTAPRGAWIRSPADAVRAWARLAAASTRTARSTPPHPSLDDDGLLHVGTAWVALSPTNEKLAKLLLADFSHTIPNSTLVRALNAGATTKSLRSYIARLRRNIEPLGLAINSERARGYSMNFASATINEDPTPAPKGAA